MADLEICRLLDCQKLVQCEIILRQICTQKLPFIHVDGRVFLV